MSKKVFLCTKLLPTFSIKLGKTRRVCLRKHIFLCRSGFFFKKLEKDPVMQMEIEKYVVKAEVLDTRILHEPQLDQSIRI